MVNVSYVCCINDKLNKDGMGLRLTEEEFNLLELISKGLTCDEIASIMHYTSGTIKNKRSMLFATMNASNAAELVAIGYQEGFLKI